MMMLPQTLTDSQLVVEFLPEGETDPTKAKTLSAALPATTLVKAGSYKIHINIKPDFDFDVELTDNQPDSHYTRFPITITPQNVTGDWVVEVEDGNDWCTLRENLVGLEENGYWIAEESAVDYSTTTADKNGPNYTRYKTRSFGSATQNSLYVFMKENPSTEPRTVKLLMYPEGENKSAAFEYELTQPGLLQIGDTYWESVEESPQVPWGFCWNRHITYYAIDAFLDRDLTGAIKFYLRREEVHNGQYGVVVTSDDYKVSWGIVTGNIMFDYSKASPSAYSEADGLMNTIVLKTTVPASVMELETTLQGYNCKTSDPPHGDLISTDTYASADAMKKNAFTIHQESKTMTGQTEYVYNPVITDADIKWYLPAIGQFPAAAHALLPNKYWSSTGVKDENSENGGTYAKSWHNGSQAEEHRINVNNHVRAVRVKP